jgi:hypothetical protein
MDIFTFMHQTNNPESKYRHLSIIQKTETIYAGT